MSLLTSSSNMRRIRALVWLLAVVAFAGAAWQAKQIWATHQEGGYNAITRVEFDREVSMAAEIAEDGSEVAPRKVADFAVIWTSPINGYIKKVEVIPEAPVDTGPKFSKKPIADVLTITSLIVDPDGGSLAYVEYKDQEENPAVSLSEVMLRVGSPLKYPYDEEPFDAKVLDIRPDGVLVLWCGDEELVQAALRSDEGGRTTVSGGTESQDSKLSDKELEVLAEARDSTETRRLPDLGPEAYLVGDEDLQMFANDESWRREVRIQEQVGAKGRKEVVLSTVKPELGRRYGVQSGDRLISINGTPVTSRAQAVRFVNQNPDLPRYDVVIERLGKQITKSVYNPKD